MRRTRSLLPLALCLMATASYASAAEMRDDRAVSPDRERSSERTGIDAAQAEGTPAVPATDTEPTDPYSRRPVCSSMYLKADWSLTPKQHVCDWLQLGLFSANAATTAYGSALVSRLRDAPSERGDGVTLRFGRRLLQHSANSTGQFVGGLVFREDPRRQPPYLTMRQTPKPRRFARFTHALAGNLVAYRCVEPCARPEDIKRVPALSRIVGAIASGATSQLWTGQTPDRRRMLNGAATAYATSFSGALVNEFSPELAEFGNRLLRMFGGF